MIHIPRHATDKRPDLRRYLLHRWYVSLLSLPGSPDNSRLVAIFTFLLFLSGYVLQQQTVHSIQAALHPKIAPPPVPSTNPVLAKHFGQPPGHSFYDKYLASNRPKGGWAKAAYVQLVRKHVEVCGAITGFARLEKEESMAQRIVMYPKEWDVKPKEGQKRDPHVETSRRLLRKAARDFRVMLQPIESIPQAAGAILTAEERYPLTNLLSPHHFNRIIFLQPSGLILDSTPLDLLFTLPMEMPMLGLSAPGPDGERGQPSILLIQPSKEAYQNLVASLPEGAYPDSEFLQRVTTESAPIEADFHTRLLAESSQLDAGSVADFNATLFLDTTGYVHISDPEPEYDIPRQELLKAMPSGKQARKAWQSVYARFRDARMNICGLDLQPLERPVDQGGGNQEILEELK